MPSSEVPSISFITSHSVQPIASINCDNNSLATTKKRLLTLTTRYTILGPAQIAKLAGIVQGVVVQITNSQSFERIFFPSTTLKATKIAGLFIS